MVLTSFSFAENISTLFRWSLLLISLILSSLCCKSTMSSSFDKVRRKNGSFYAGDIRLDPFETIRVVGEAEGVRDGLEFTVPGREARITDFWRGDGVSEAQTGHFHVISLQNGLRFPLSGFVLELLHDYGVAPS